MDGIIIVNKEKGYTSNDVVQIVKKIYNEKVGHTGTLDPMATGVLPLLVGKGTLLSKYLINHDKTYEATLKLGIKTDTGDTEGKIVEQKEVNENIFNEEYINTILKSFIGEQIQIPPIYSAIKVNGKKLYEYARNNQEVQIPTRSINIYDIKLISIDKASKEICFKVSCSKGTYIRSLCEDIANKLGTIGYMSDLKRTRVGIFDVKNAISIEDVKNNKANLNIISIEEFFKDYKSIILDKNDMTHFFNGVKIQTDKKDGVYKIYNGKSFVGTGIVSNNSLKRDIVL